MAGAETCCQGKEFRVTQFGGLTQIVKHTLVLMPEPTESHSNQAYNTGMEKPGLMALNQSQEPYTARTHTHTHTHIHGFAWF